MIRMGKMRGEILFLLFIMARYCGLALTVLVTGLYIFIFIPLSWGNYPVLIQLFYIYLACLAIWGGGYWGMEYITPWLIKHTRPQYELNRR
ncbi:hypothetical protein, partial [Pokkaliibacter plantistimulans]